MSKEWWIMLLTLAAAIIGSAVQMLTLSADMVQLLGWLIVVINIILTTVFGVAGYRIYQARKTAEAEAAAGRVK